MRLQKWLVRGWVFTILAAMAGAGALYQHWTDPAIVREQVMTHLEVKLPGADVTLEAARLRILGGILLTDLRVFRRDDPSRNDVAYIPSGVVSHDKERLLDGQLTFRKVELHRPRLRVVRGRDGGWNVLGLVGPPDLSAPLPTVVVHEGTLVFEDRAADPPAPPLELTGVQLTLINDPLPAVRIAGTAHSPGLGEVEVSGTWQRGTNRLALTLKSRGTHVTPALIARVAGRCAGHRLDELELDALADLEFSLTYDPLADRPLDYDLGCRLYAGRCTHPALPLACQDLEATARCRNGHLRLERLAARAGGTEITARGAGLLPCLPEQFEGTVLLKDLPVTRELCARLPEAAGKLYTMFQPAGLTDARLEAKVQDGVWQRKRCVLRPQNMEACFAHFAYPVRNLAGELDVDLLREAVAVDLRSDFGGRELTLAGHWRGKGADAEANLWLRGKDIPLDQALSDALRPELHELASSFHPTGRADFTASFARGPGSEEFQNEFHVRFHGATVRWDHFPYPVRDVSGFVDVYPGHWECRDFVGRNGAGKVVVSGRSVPGPAGESSRVVIDIAGEGIGIDGDLRQALTPMPNLARAWDTLRPGGSLNFRAQVDRVPGRPQDLDITVDVAGCRIEPAFYPCPFTDLSGRFRYRDNRLDLKDVRARHRTSNVSIESGAVDLSPGGGYYADLRDVRGDPVFPQDGFLAALPPKLRDAFGAMGLKAPLAVQTRLVLAQSEEPGSLPDVYWDGRVWFRDAAVNLGVGLDGLTGSFACAGRHNGRQLLGLSGNVLLERARLFNQPFSNAHARVRVDPDTPETLVLALRAPVFGGDVSGQVRVDFHSSVRYEMNLTASQIDLEQFGRQNLGRNSELEGLASARLHLTGRGEGADTLDGNGTIDIPRGKLYNLPLLLDLLKFLGLRWPDRTAFEEAHAGFSVQGRRLVLSRLDLWGNAVSLTGEGEVNLDGTDVNLDFYPSWARVEQLLPPLLREVSPAVSKSLLKIEVRGKVGGGPDDLRFHKRPVPVIVDPLLDLRDRVARIRQAETAVLPPARVRMLQR